MGLEDDYMTVVHVFVTISTLYTFFPQNSEIKGIHFSKGSYCSHMLTQIKIKSWAVFRVCGVPKLNCGFGAHTTSHFPIRQNKSTTTVIFRPLKHKNTAVIARFAAASALCRARSREPRALLSSCATLNATPGAERDERREQNIFVVFPRYVEKKAVFQILSRVSLK